MDTHLYYLPLFFQTAQSQSASQSGVRLLPYLLTMVVATIIGGMGVSVIHYYVPLIVVGAAGFTVGSGLLHTLNTTSQTSQWVGFEVLTGLGFGLCVQLPYTAVRLALSKQDFPIGGSLIVFFQALGGATGISIAQNILASRLTAELQVTPGIKNATAIVEAGAGQIAAASPEGLIDQVIQAYGVAISDALLLPVAGAALAFMCSLGFEWKRVTKP